jgi:hypothetical protein
MPTSLDREPPVPSSALPRVRQRLSRAAERAMFALAMTLLSPACQDPQYGDLSNPSEGNSGGADSSTARTSPRDAAAAGKPDSRASATGTDGGNRSGDDRGPTGRESVTQSDASDDNKPPIGESADAGGPVVSAVPKWAKPVSGPRPQASRHLPLGAYGTLRSFFRPFGVSATDRSEHRVYSLSADAWSDGRRQSVVASSSDLPSCRRSLRARCGVCVGSHALDRTLRRARRRRRTPRGTLEP